MYNHYLPIVKNKPFIYFLFSNKFNAYLPVESKCGVSFHYLKNNYKMACYFDYLHAADRHFITGGSLSCWTTCIMGAWIHIVGIACLIDFSHWFFSHKNIYYRFNLTLKELQNPAIPPPKKTYSPKVCNPRRLHANRVKYHQWPKLI